MRAARLPAVGAVFPDDGFDLFLFLVGELAGAGLSHLLVDGFLPHQRAVDVIGPVRPGFRAANERVRHVAQDLFQRPAVVFVQAQQEKREHREHHADGRGACAQPRPEPKEKRHADQRAATEADDLPPGEVEDYLALDSCQVFGNGNVGQ